jgi:Zn-dependent protease
LGAVYQLKIFEKLDILMETLFDYLLGILIYGPPILIAITFHEAAHGYIALKLGDDTAKRLERVTFNPLKHIDRFGTIVLPLFLLLVKAPFLFGYAKPVPVNFRRLLKPRRDMILVAVAGPATNILLAFASIVLLKILIFFVGTTAENLHTTSNFLPVLVQSLVVSVQFNVVLAVFNMLPLLPLDGGRVIVGLLPPHLSISFEKLERWGMFILIGLLFIVPMLANQFNIEFNPLSSLIRPIIKVIAEGLLNTVVL